MTIPAFLGVESSLTGRRWKARNSDDRLALALAQAHALPELVGRLLAGRGVGVEEVERFLSPTLRAFMPDPSVLRDMDVAADRLARAIRDGEKVAVFGDYDVDGATSTALLNRFFRAVGRQLRVYIPDRIEEGYGPNLPALLKLKEEGIGLVVTVDCGVTSFDPLHGAVAAGLEVVVVDHHKAEPRLPSVTAVVNPNRLDEPAGGPLSTLAAVGVTFLLIVAVNRALRKGGFYSNGRTEPDLMSWLDIVALGTVCDVVPLVGLNRAFVAQGLRIMGKRANIGISALADVAGVNEAMDAYHAGYIIGPRVNAGGRVGRADLGTRLLSTESAAEAADLAKELHAFNAERRAIEAAVLEEAIAATETVVDESPELVLAVGEGWHPGVIGIVASRLKDRYNRPACVVALDGMVGKASGRSVRGVDLGSAIIAARQAGLLVAGGGHAMAAGFTVEREKIDDLRAFLRDRIARQLDDAGPLVPSLSLDGALSVRAANPDLLRHLEKLAPYGTGNSEPRFAVTDARIVKADVVGAEGKHVRCILTGSDGSRLKSIAFRAMDGDLGPALLQSGGRPMHLAGTLRPDRWNGNDGVQLLIDDGAVSGGAG
ncbi:single-stranded-DNA-specific exonuclease RecJ [Niveispirillum sp.]|uniref:single-stranded-DNA-specific exonuclease RecJ n=1 Tax=Niveispirillum sp. TaxID=1917217 RepID=UPI001B759737|nr:single-stranded-DNA-specific exonuclease RecJ [Niveispirillum sp.]MBP7335831.1 single-stranded-DNA-specific exonuclease RecJ [Niveispirillum sp.]